MDLTVTKQPGDNFAIVASKDSNQISGVTVDGLDLKKNGSAISKSQTTPTTFLIRSELLTVWRKLYIEADSMGVVSNNKVDGTFPLTQTIAANGNTTLTVNPNSTMATNRFENGRLVTSAGPFSVIDATGSVTANTTNTVTINNPSGNTFTVVNGSSFDLFDDDNYDSSIGDLNGDIGKDVQATNLTFSLMQTSDEPTENVFAAAYITPEYGWANNQGYNQGNITFELNRTRTITQAETYLNTIRNSNSDESDDFWVGYVLLGYQHYIASDMDPDTEYSASPGPAGGITSVFGDADTVPASISNFPRGGDNTVLYLETCRDIDIESPKRMLQVEFEFATAPHEIGHQMGLAGDTSGYGIMHTNETLIFVPNHLNMLRTRRKSPGK